VVCLEDAVAAQYGAAYVHRTGHQHWAVIVWSADVAAAPPFPGRTAMHGHRMPGIERLMAPLA